VQTLEKVSRMSFEGMYTFGLLLVGLVIAVILGAVVYLAARNRRVRRETGREFRIAEVPVGTTPEESTQNTAERVAPREPRREFYKSMGLETTEDMKLRGYSIAEYRDELGGTQVRPDSGFIAAIKSYRQPDDESGTTSPLVRWRTCWSSCWRTTR
jgi:hypothetical protein